MSSHNETMFKHVSARRHFNKFRWAYHAHIPFSRCDATLVLDWCRRSVISVMPFPSLVKSANRIGLRAAGGTFTTFNDTYLRNVFAAAIMTPAVSVSGTVFSFQRDIASWMLARLNAFPICGKWLALILSSFLSVLSQILAVTFAAPRTANARALVGEPEHINRKRPTAASTGFEFHVLPSFQYQTHYSRSSEMVQECLT